MEYTEEWLEAVRKSFNLSYNQPILTGFIPEYTPGDKKHWEEVLEPEWVIASRMERLDDGINVAIWP